MLLQTLFITSAAFSLSSCCTPIPVSVNDETIYFIKGSATDASTYPKYAVQLHFLSSGSVDLTKDQLDALTKDGMVLMSAAAFEDFNAEIGKFCSQVTCDYQALQAWNDLYARLQKAGYVPAGVNPFNEERSFGASAWQ